MRLLLQNATRGGLSVLLLCCLLSSLHAAEKTVPDDFYRTRLVELEANDGSILKTASDLPLPEDRAVFYHFLSQGGLLVDTYKALENGRIFRNPLLLARQELPTLYKAVYAAVPALKKSPLPLFIFLTDDSTLESTGIIADNKQLIALAIGIRRKECASLSATELDQLLGTRGLQVFFKAELYRRFAKIAASSKLWVVPAIASLLALATPRILSRFFNRILGSKGPNMAAAALAIAAIIAFLNNRESQNSNYQIALLKMRLKKLFVKYLSDPTIRNAYLQTSLADLQRTHAQTTAKDVLDSENGLNCAATWYAHQNKIPPEHLTSQRQMVEQQKTAVLAHQQHLASLAKDGRYLQKTVIQALVAPYYS